MSDILYFTQGSCALASLAALEDAGRPYKPVRLEMGPDGAGSDAFAGISPLRQVPVLKTPGGVVRETGAILTWLAARHPEAGVLPADEPGRLAALEWIGFLGGSVHPMFRLLWRPARYVGAGEGPQAALRENSGAYLRRALGVIEARIAGRDWVLGERSAIDLYLHVFTRWLAGLKAPLPPALAAHHARTAALPAMARAFEVEATTPVNAEA